MTAERRLTMSLKTKKNLKRRDFTKEFILKVLAELDGGMGMANSPASAKFIPTRSPAGEIKLVNIKTSPFVGRGKTCSDEARITELERMVGRLTMENDLLKKA